VWVVGRGGEEERRGREERKRGEQDEVLRFRS
jgi:hypothetical protein